MANFSIFQHFGTPPIGGWSAIQHAPACGCRFSALQHVSFFHTGLA